MYQLICRKCKLQIRPEHIKLNCPTCSGPLHFSYAASSSREEVGCHTMWRYRSSLPVGPDSPIVTLGEGGTPLQKARCPELVEVYLKNETLNPTGSQKDRALSVAISKAKELGYQTVMLYSDGSTALASAAYSARANIRNITVLPRGAPDERLAPLVVYNSLILEYQGGDAEAVDWVHETCSSLGIYETTTTRLANPYQAEGAKTIGLEIFSQLGKAPDWIVIPVGGGGTLAGIWRAFEEIRRRDTSVLMPRVVGVLPTHYDILERTLQRGVTEERDYRAMALRNPPQTLQVKIAMSCPPDGLEAVEAVRISGGCFLYASDEEAVEAQRRLGKCEGIYAEPSAAVVWTGMEKLIQSGTARPGDSIVGVVTGSGFRETGLLMDRLKVKRVPVSSETKLDELKDLVASQRRTAH